MRSVVLSISALASALSAVPARAEVLQVFGLIPARSDRLAALRSIVVDGFGGSEGAAMTIRVEDMLRAISLDGGPYFRVLPAATASGGGDALLRGTADADIQFQRFTEQREACAEKDGDGKCLRKEQREFKCSRRRITLQVSLRVVQGDGTLIHSDDAPEQAEQTACEEDEQPPRSRGDVIRDLIGRYAERLRPDFAPRFTDALIRVDENRKGLAKGDAERFRQAIRLTKTDPRAACATWAQVGAANPAHVPTQFNLALCDEARGEGGARAAQAGYLRVLDLAPKNSSAAAGLGRLDRSAQARAQLAAHQGG